MGEMTEKKNDQSTTQVQSASPNPPNQSNVNPSNTTFTSSSNTEKSNSGLMGKIKSHKTIIIVLAAIVAVILIVLAVIFLFPDRPSNDMVQQDLKQDVKLRYQGNYAHSDAIANPTVKVTDYEISDEGNTKFCVVNTDISGENSDFKMDGTIQILYAKDKNNSKGKWREFIAGDPDLTYTPKHGVDTLDQISSGADPDVESTLEQSDDGTYHSHATKTKTNDYWFGTESRTTTADFVFDQKKGWVQDGDTNYEDPKMDWDLAGKTFKIAGGQEELTGYLGGTVTSLVTINSVDGNKITGSYDMHYTPKASSKKYYRSVDVSGNLNGTLSRSSTSGYSATLNDTDHNATLILNFSSSNNLNLGGTTSSFASSQIDALKFGAYYKSDISLKNDSSTPTLTANLTYQVSE